MDGATMTHTVTVKAIETRYAGCRFRSRLEARWAVFFDRLNIPWEYEPQGYTLSNGRNYLPDFFLPQCATWIEVKGSVEAVDVNLLNRAASDIPSKKPWPKCELGPKLMLLGPIPRPMNYGDYGWASWYDYERGIDVITSGFGDYYQNRRPWQYWNEEWQSEMLFGIHYPDEVDYAQEAYEAARSARFEHGECG